MADSLKFLRALALLMIARTVASMFADDCTFAIPLTSNEFAAVCGNFGSAFTPYVCDHTGTVSMRESIRIHDLLSRANLSHCFCDRWSCNTWIHRPIRIVALIVSRNQLI